MFRYKYLQKPLEEISLPTLLQYINRWSPAQRDKLSIAVGLLISQGLASASCLSSLSKDHLVKNGERYCQALKFSSLTTYLFPQDVSINVLTLIFRAYLVDQSMEHLSATLKRGGIKDLLQFFPPNRREGKILDDHFRREGLPQVADWWSKKQYAGIKAELVKELTDMCEREETTDQVS